MNKIPFNPYDFFGYLSSGLLLIVGMELTLGFPKVLWKNLAIVDGGILLLGIYVGGQIAGMCAKALMEDIVVGRILKPPSVNLLREKIPFIGSILFPTFYKPFPDSIQKKICLRAKNQNIERAGEKLFLHVRYSPEILKNDRLMNRLEVFLNAYGFARNLSLASLAVGVGLIIRGWVEQGFDLRGYGTCAIIAGVLLFYRYLKFYRQYSFELFNVFANESQNGSQNI